MTTSPQQPGYGCQQQPYGLEPRTDRQQLRRDYPDRPEMHVTHETIYQALYVQGRGELRRELTKPLRTGRAQRRPHRRADQRQPRFIDTNQKSAIGTLVKRSTRCLMLVHLPIDRTSQHMRDAA